MVGPCLTSSQSVVFVYQGFCLNVSLCKATVCETGSPVL